ncbi:MAG: strong similarity to group II intron-encoded protein LtrA [Candidatus Scalindua rubra]|uniref:RNA-directed DNA polymerase n=2 Tax=Candidatus Scalindua TaxID=236756 RepID=A0A1E3X2I4_9BACT|nr:MAG: strong similarity to group II intron-encoded protein LtrA [Candidatus Scalindua rubra]
MSKAKPFSISKESVMVAWESVKANKGSSGIDEESIRDFEANLKGNLYKIWNRMSSGTYFPPPVMAVEIPKNDGRIRLLGIPTVSDRVAQAVIKLHLEPIVEPKFHDDSYGYRPGKSALDAVGVARKRCWRQDWVIDLDIKGFFDNLDHELMMKAVRFHTDEKWIHLYVERWLKAPLQQKDGQLIKRDKGTPQGGVASPLLANIFMHHAYDMWIGRHFPYVKFERFADDSLVHCSSQKQAEEVLEAIEKRLQECGLELHPKKTKIVYCKDVDRKESHDHESFDFLGYTFRPRLSKNKYGKTFVNFTPAISKDAANRIRKEIRSWKIHLRSDKNLTDLAKMFRSQVQGWVNYYGRYYKSAMYSVLRNIERNLIRWATRKYKRLRGHRRRAKYWLGRIRGREPRLFVHWRLGLGSPVG